MMEAREIRVESAVITAKRTALGRIYLYRNFAPFQLIKFAKNVSWSPGRGGLKKTMSKLGRKMEKRSWTRARSLNSSGFAWIVTAASVGEQRMTPNRIAMSANMQCSSAIRAPCGLMTLILFGVLNAIHWSEFRCQREGQGRQNQ